MYWDVDTVISDLTLLRFCAAISIDHHFSSFLGETNCFLRQLASGIQNQSSIRETANYRYREQEVDAYFLHRSRDASKTKSLIRWTRSSGCQWLFRSTFKFMKKRHGLKTWVCWVNISTPRLTGLVQSWQQLALYHGRNTEFSVHTYSFDRFYFILASFYILICQDKQPSFRFKLFVICFSDRFQYPFVISES